MIEVIFPAGFTPAERTLDSVIATLAEISSDSPARPLGQAHHWHQPRERHQLLVIEDWRGLRPDMG